MTHYVYFIGNGKRSKYIKIGVSKNPRKRLNDLQTANPLQLSILHMELMNSEKHAYHVEAKLHRRFEAKRVKGEWFIDLPLKTAIEICRAGRDKYTRSIDNITCNLDREAIFSMPVTMQ